MTTLSFAGGTLGATYVVPGTHIGYGVFKYTTVSPDQIYAQSGGFAQLVDAAVITSNFSGSFVLAWGGTASASEAAACVINAARTGWSAIFTGTTVLLRKEVAGSGGATITAAVASGLTTAGDYTIDFTWNNTTGAITVSVNGVPKIAGIYNDNLTNMRGGLQNYNDNSAHAFKSLTTSQAATTSIDSVTTGGVSGLVVGQEFNFTTTGLADVSGGINIKTAATPAAQTDAISIVQTAGDGSAAVKFFADGQYMPFPGTATVTITGTGGAPAGNFPFAIPADHFDVIFGAVSLQDNTYLGFALNAIGHPLEGGATPDRAYWINTNGLIFGTDGKISCNSAMTSALWIHKKSGIIEGYTVQINDAGQITIGGIPSSNLLFFLM